jgi:hypothetical protein
MARSFSWLDRIVPISRTVAGSARSHYDRHDLQQLFELQSRSAQQLMAALPNISVGRARLVEREVLSDFLRQLHESDNPADTFSRLRNEGKKTVRRKLRNLSLREVVADVDSPPHTMTLAPGEMRVQFQTLEELAEAMLYLAAVFEHDLDGFARRYEPAIPRNFEETAHERRIEREVASYRDWKP